MTKIFYFPLLLAVVLQTGCMSVSTRQSSTETRGLSLPAEEPRQPSQEPEKKSETPPSAPSRSRYAAKGEGRATPPAVLALMREAEASRSGGQLDNAAATLERAIRIQPRSSALWQQLASVRLEQHQPGLAEDLAKKSNVLAQGNRDLIRKNWAIIAAARRQKGDAQGAAEADAKAGR